MNELLKDREGWYFVSRNGIKYKLYEGMTFGEKNRYSDSSAHIFLEVIDNVAEERFCSFIDKFDACRIFVDYVYVDTDDMDEETEKCIRKLIDEFESSHKEIVNFINEKEETEMKTTEKENDIQIAAKDEKIKMLENEIKELREALLLATRGKKMKTKDIKVSMSTFYNITQEILRREDNDKINMEDDIYGHDVTVHFHGLYCNCLDGASVFNSVIEGVAECAEENDEETFIH